MILELNRKKPFWISNIWITSGMFIFDYKDINKINNLPELFKIEIEWKQFSATINWDTKTPILLDTSNISYKCNRWEWREDLNWVSLAQIKLDIYIDDLLCWMIRTYKIKIL